MTLSIIIVNYNVRCFLEQCLYSVQKAAEGISHEVIVVDNASVDDSRDCLPHPFPEVRFIWNPQNLGFAKACNIGAGYASGNYVLFLNPDTILSEDSLKGPLAYMDQHPQVGGLGIRMINGSGFYLRESMRSFPSPLTALMKLSGISSLFPGSALFARYHLGHSDPAISQPVEVLAGAYMMLRREALEKTGGFDERFFMYGEDIDLSLRLIRSGYENHYYAGSTILHFKGESNRRHSFRHAKYFYGAMLDYVRKYYTGLFRYMLEAGIVSRAFFSFIFIFLRRMASVAAAFIPRSKTATVIPAYSQGPYIHRISKALEQKGGRHLADAGMPDMGSLPNPSGDAVVHVGLGKSKEVLVCPPACNYQQLIQWLSTSPGKHRILISAEGSASIVGAGMAVSVDPDHLL